MSTQPLLTQSQINLIRATWTKVTPIADTAAGLFYDRLLEQNPELKPLFSATDMPSQKAKLVKAISLVVNSLDKLDTLLPVIRDLGVRHVDYGARAEHYDMVGAALLWTLETGLSEHWNDEVATAWTNAYALLANVMIDAAEQSVSNVA